MAFVVNLLTSVTLRGKLAVSTGFFLLLYFNVQVSVY